MAFQDIPVETMRLLRNELLTLELMIQQFAQGSETPSATADDRADAIHVQFDRVKSQLDSALVESMSP